MERVLVIFLAASIACTASGPAGPQGPAGPAGPQGPVGPAGTFTGAFEGTATFGGAVINNGSLTLNGPLMMPGSSPESARASCDELHQLGLRVSGLYFINPSGSSPLLAYCDMQTNGGGWTLVYNSVLGINTLNFWNIRYADRFQERGSPGVDNNYYNGSFYPFGKGTWTSLKTSRARRSWHWKPRRRGSVLHPCSLRRQFTSRVAAPSSIRNLRVDGRRRTSMATPRPERTVLLLTAM